MHRSLTASAIAVLCAVLLSSPSTAQTLVERQFSNSIPLVVGDMHRLPGGDVLMACSSYPSGLDSSMAILVRTDSLLQPKWSKRFAMQTIDFFSAITPLAGGNLLVGGSSRPPFGTPRGACVYKADTAASVIWHRSYSESADDRILAMFEEADHSLMLFVRKGVNNSPTKIIHADSTGNVLSVRAWFLGSQGLFAEGVATDGAGHYYLAGSLFSTSLGYNRLFVCGADTGTVTWCMLYDMGRDVSAYGIAWLSDGTLGIAGTISDASFPSTTNGWIMKADAQGVPAWAAEYGQAQAFSESFFGLAAAANGSVIAFGQANTSLGFQAMAMHADAGGTVTWSNAYGTYPYQAMGRMLAYPDGRKLFSATATGAAYLLLTGTSGTSACNGTALPLVKATLTATAVSAAPADNPPAVTPASPAFTVMPVAIDDSTLCSSASGVPESLPAGIRMYPVPVTDRLHVEIPADAGACIVMLTDARGDRLGTEKASGGEPFMLYLGDLSPGLYFVTLITGKGMIHRRVVKY